MDLLGEFPITEVFDDYGIIGSQSILESKLKQLRVLNEIENKKIIVIKLMRELEANYEQQKSTENQPKIPEKQIDPLEQRMDEMNEQESQNASRLASEVGSKLKESMGERKFNFTLPLEIILFYWIVKYKEDEERIRGLLKLTPEEQENAIKLFANELGGEKRQPRIKIYNRFLKFNPGTEIKITPDHAYISQIYIPADFDKGGDLQSGQKRIKSREDADMEVARGLANQKTIHFDKNMNGDKEKMSGYIESVFDILGTNKIVTKHEIYQDGMNIFTTDYLAIFIKEDGLLKVIWKPDVDSDQIEDFVTRFKDSGMKLDDFCMYENVHYDSVKHLSKTTLIDENNKELDPQQWMDRQESLILRPYEWSEWKITPNTEYNSNDFYQLKNLGFRPADISTLYNSTIAYRKVQSIEFPPALEQYLLNMDNYNSLSDEARASIDENGKLINPKPLYNKIMRKEELLNLFNEIHEGIKDSAKGDITASESGKQSVPKKVLEILNSDFDNAFGSKIIRDYINSFTQALSNATTIKVLVNSKIMEIVFRDLNVDENKKTEVNIFLGNFVTRKDAYQNEKESIPTATIGLFEQLIPTFLNTALKILKSKNKNN
jgi:hypothetical protein